MTSEELTQLATIHQQAIVRHEQEMADIRALIRLNQEQFRDQREFTQEQLNQLTAGLLELRHLVADYIQGRLRN